MSTSNLERERQFLQGRLAHLERLLDHHKGRRGNFWRRVGRALVPPAPVVHNNLLLEVEQDAPPVNEDLVQETERNLLRRAAKGTSATEPYARQCRSTTSPKSR